jgi:hypothetical protein
MALKELATAGEGNRKRPASDTRWSNWRKTLRIFELLH